MLNERKINRKIGEHVNIVKFFGASSVSGIDGKVYKPAQPNALDNVEHCYY